MDENDVPTLFEVETAWRTWQPQHDRLMELAPDAIRDFQNMLNTAIHAVIDTRYAVPPAGAHMSLRTQVGTLYFRPAAYVSVENGNVTWRDVDDDGGKSLSFAAVLDPEARQREAERVVAEAENRRRAATERYLSEREASERARLRELVKKYPDEVGK